MLKLLILTSALLAITLAAPPSNDRIPTSPVHGDHKDDAIVPIEDLSTLSKSSREEREELEKKLGINRQRRDHHEGHDQKSNEKKDDHKDGDKKALVQPKPLVQKQEDPKAHEHHKRDVVAGDKQPEKTAEVLVHEEQHKGPALKDHPLLKPENAKKEIPSNCQCKKEKRDVHELPGVKNCQCQKEKRDIPNPEGEHKHETKKPNEHPHDDIKDVSKKDSSEESSSDEKHTHDKLHLSQRQKRDIHELTKEHDKKPKDSSSSEESSSQESKEEKHKDGSSSTTTTTTTTAAPQHNNNKRDLPVPNEAKHEHPASISEVPKDAKPQVEDLNSHIPPSAKPIHAHTATVAHTTHYTTTAATPGQHQHPLISKEPIPIKSLRPHEQA